MDFAGASLAATQLMAGAGGLELMYAAPMLPSKTKWEIQINGSYNLIYPFLHKDYPTRTELQLYTQDRILDAFFLHNLNNKHNGAYCTPGINTPSEISPVPQLNMETINNKFGEVILSKVDPVFKNIGYGI